jgi:SSS family solute:Na+ symporter
MTTADWIVLAVYLAAMVAMSLWVGRSQRTQDEYYLAGRKLGGLVVALSILATQISAISLVGGPAFVAVKKGGGLVWLQYEFAVPLAMIAILVILVPAYRALGVTSIYELLERRFDARVRKLVSAIFLLSRGLANGVALYAASLVVAMLLGLPLLWAMIGLGAVAILYTTVGGIRADVYTDAVQLVLLWGATLACCGIALHLLGGSWQVPAERLRVIDTDPAGTFSIWPMVIGGFFLYVSYYGCDQSQAQRLLTTRGAREAQRSLLLNGLLRFPLAATYCALGLLLAAFLAARPDFAARVEKPDHLVPLFLLHHVPAGLRGLMVAGILAAAMSSFDSAFNSLSAATVRDFGRGESIRASRLWTVFWGAFCVGAGVLFSRSADTVIEVVNKIGSVFYGPILAVFVLALLRRRAAPGGAAVGLVLGVGANVALWLFAPKVSWLWWNAAGFGVAFLAGLAAPRRDGDPLPRSWPVPAVAALASAFAVMLLLGMLMRLA